MPRCLLQCSHYVDRLDWENFAGGGLTNPRCLFGTGSLTSVSNELSKSSQNNCIFDSLL